MRTIIRKTALGLWLAGMLLLVSCAPNPPMEYFNTREGCLLGETYYENLSLRVWNPGWGEVQEGLCRDPLCTHDSEDSLCPSSRQLWMKTLVTDGERLYMNATNPALTDENGTVYRQIFSLKPDGSAFTLLHTYDFSANSSIYMQYADGYLYFEQGFYEEDFGAGAGGIFPDQQRAYVMRIPVDGGKAERVFAEALDIQSAFYADEVRDYLLYPDEAGEVRMDIIDRASGEVRENAAADVEGRPVDITVYAGSTYLRTREEVDAICPSDDGGTHRYAAACFDLYVYRDGEWVKVCDNADGFTFGGGIWFAESETLYLGTKDLPNGGPGGETDPTAFYVHATRALCRIDPHDHSVTRYTPAGDVQPEDTVTVRCAAASGLWVEVTNGRAEYAGDASAYHCRACIENGSMMLHRMDE